MDLFSGGNGSSKENAIYINIENEGDGVNAEYYYMDLLHSIVNSSWKLIRQSLIHDGEKSYDILLVETSLEQKEFWFDISKFYGKYKSAEIKK